MIDKMKLSVCILNCIALTSNNPTCTRSFNIHITVWNKKRTCRYVYSNILSIWGIPNQFSCQNFIDIFIMRRIIT